MRINKKDIIYAILIFVIIAPLFLKAVLAHGNFITGLSVFSDGIDTPYPRIELSARFIKEGIAPLWNPFTYCGYPLLANAQAGSFYPLDILLFLLLPTHVAHNASLLIHLFLMGIFTYCFAKVLGLNRTSAFFSATVFIFSAFVVSHTDSLARVRAMLWMPAAFLLIEKYILDGKKIFIYLLGAVFGMQLLSGYYSIVVYSIFSSFLYFLARFFFQQDRARFPVYLMNIVFAIVVGLGISAVQNVPTLELFLLSDRYVGKNIDFIFDNSTSPIAFLTFFYPFTANKLPSNFDVQTNMYMGLIPFFLFLLAAFKVKDKKKYAFLFIASVALFFALGENNPLFAGMLDFFIFLKYLGRSYRFLFISTFAFAVLAGFGLQYLINCPGKICFPKNRMRSFIIYALIILTVAELLFISFNYLGLSLAAQHLDKRRADYIPDAVFFLKNNLGVQRMFSVRDNDKFMVDTLEADNNIRFSIKSAIGNMEFPLAWYETAMGGMNTGNNLYFLRSAGVKYIVSDRKNMNPLLKQGPSYGSIYIYEVPNPLERIRLLSRIKISSSFKESLDLINQGKIDLERELVLEDNPGSSVQRLTKLPELENKKIALLSDTPLGLDLKVDVSGPAFLAVSDLFYPGWKATVDGKKENIYRANGSFRAVFLDKGSHLVRFFYDPFSFKLGALISLVTISLLGFSFLRERRNINCKV